MSFDALLGTTQRLNVSVEALAALAAYLRLRTEERDPGPEVATLLQTVVTELGIDAAPPEPLPQALNALRIVRSGGHPWTPEETATLLEQAGFADVTVIERTWSTPIQLVVGCAN